MSGKVHMAICRLSASPVAFSTGSFSSLSWARGEGFSGHAVHALGDGIEVCWARSRICRKLEGEGQDGFLCGGRKGRGRFVTYTSLHLPQVYMQVRCG